MDLFYLNGSSLLFLQLNYRSNVPFSRENKKIMKKEKSNLTEDKKKKEKENTIHNFADSVPFGIFSLFFFLMDS